MRVTIHHRNLIHFTLPRMRSTKINFLTCLERSVCQVSPHIAESYVVFECDYDEYLTRARTQVHASNLSQHETVVISAAAGAVGIIAGQIARVERGSRVVGICGSEEKCKMLTETLGFDVAINYKSPEFESHLSDTLNVSGFDVYFDSVGGSVSESVLQYANLNARVPICGQIASYEQNISYDELVSSDEHFTSSKLRDHLRSQQVERFRYLVLDYEDHFEDSLTRLKMLCKNGEVIPLESVTKGFRPHEAFVDMMNGKNIGKAVVKI